MSSRTSFALPLTAVAVLAFTSVVVAACSSSRASISEGPADPPFVEPDASPSKPEAPTCQELSCSRDLKKVLRGCTGAEEVVAECGPDEGCGNGACVDACQSAELSKGSLGCSFWTLPQDDFANGRGACFAAMIANTWDRAVTITAGLGADPLDVSNAIYTAENQGKDITYTRLVGPLPPGKVGLVFLAQADPRVDMAASPCPLGVTPAFSEDPIRHGTSITRAFHLQTDAPVSAYSIFPYGGASSFYPTATLLLPTSSWDTSYVAVSPASIGDGPAVQSAPRTLQIVANEDDTEVQMRPVADIIGTAEVGSATSGVTMTWKLSRGQVLQINQQTNLSGSPIATNKPVGVFGGSRCTYLPAAYQACDLTQQQIAPFAQWGREYALVPYQPRITSTSPDAREVVPWSLVGAVDGTALEYHPARPQGAPETLAAGQVATFMTEDIVVVRSQDASHPFHAAVYMTGTNYTQGGSRQGDPDFVIVAPSEQFLDRYVFFADYTFPETSLTVVRRKTAKGFLPVELDCAGEVTGFRPIGTNGEYEFAWMKLTAGSAAQPYTKGTCGYGRHEARSDGPFSVTVWGTGPFASYGYVGGMGSRPVNLAPPPPVN